MGSVLLVSKAEAKPPLVEMFTSTLCPRCPLAELGIAEKMAEGKVFALNYHIDISNGRRNEPYATKATEARGWLYQKHRGKRVIETPLLIGQGELALSGAKIYFLESYLDQLENKGLTPSATLTSYGNSLKLSLPAKSGHYMKEIWMVTYDKIQRHATHKSPSNVVRTVERIDSWDGVSAKNIKLSHFSDQTGAYVALLIQDPLGGKIVDYLLSKRP